ncbi:MAG: YMGG-like glycine zipper-containing protein [Pseudomonadota bacterium]
MRSSLLLAGAAAMSLAACTSTGNIERNAVKGAAIGAAAGAIIGNNSRGGDAEEGAEVGAVVGAIAGGLIGRRQDQQQEGGTYRRGRKPAQLTYDERADRYYYYDAATDRYSWQNGEPRY